MECLVFKESLNTHKRQDYVFKVFARNLKKLELNLYMYFKQIYFKTEKESLLKEISN